MPGSAHHGLSPRGSNTNRGQHPDLDEYNNIRWETYMDPDRRTFFELRNDPVRWAAFMDGVAARQRREAQDVQSWVGGQHYPGDPLEAFQDYQADLQTAREVHGQDRTFTSYDVADMDLATYDRCFDETGRPREGYSFRPTDRDIVPDSQAVERFSRDENLRQSRDWR